MLCERIELATTLLQIDFFAAGDRELVGLLQVDDFTGADGVERAVFAKKAQQSLYFTFGARFARRFFARSMASQNGRLLNRFKLELCRGR